MAKDMAKRKRVMARSMRLGHCICDPRKPCPCDLFRERDVCLCAGERLEVEATGPVKLTELVENPGCASKIDQASLKRILGGLPAPEFPGVIVGMPAGDDAGVFEVNEHTTLVQTVDVFSPAVDDPYTFGRVAAANSVSDIYAMGAKPLTALSIVGFPVRTVADDVLREILRGGIDAMAEAGVAVIGGHSIKDEEIKAGFAVTGVVDPARILTNAGAQVGDVLVLTKPLGVGIVNFAAQIGRASAASVQAAVDSMCTLNRCAAEAALELGAHACTDVTGFALGGHLSEMARQSGVDVELVWDDIPLLPGVLELLAAGVIPGGVERNRESCGDAIVPGEGVTAPMVDLCLDAQTSGGLLLAFAPDAAGEFVRRMREAGQTDTAVVGGVSREGDGRIVLTTRGERSIPEAVDSDAAGCCAEPEPEATCCSGETEETACCADAEPERESACCASAAPLPKAAPNASVRKTSGGSPMQDKFMAFMKSVNTPGALDAATKQALNLALSIHAKCEPCTATHLKKARDMGFSEEEIDEIAWTAIAFGGSPAMMFYKGFQKDK